MRNLIEEVWPEGGLRTLLDLGAGDCWFTAGLPGVEVHVAVDLHEPALEKARAKNIPGLKTYAMDIREFVRTQAAGQYDAVLAIDVIEHLARDEALFLVREMDRIAKHIAIIWTTLGWIDQSEFDNDGNWNPYQKHVWGPMPSDFEGGDWKIEQHPEWHGERGGGLFIWKINEPPRVNPLDQQVPPWV